MTNEYFLKLSYRQQENLLKNFLRANKTPIFKKIIKHGLSACELIECKKNTNGMFHGYGNFYFHEAIDFFKKNKKLIENYYLNTYEDVINEIHKLPKFFSYSYTDISIALFSRINTHVTYLTRLYVRLVWFVCEELAKEFSNYLEKINKF